MAYHAALISLSQTAKQIPQSVPQLIMLQEKVTCLLEILEDSSQKKSLNINDLEGQIRDVAYEAEDFIESHISRHGSRFWDLELQGLEKISNEFDSILEALSKVKGGKVEDLQPKNSLSACSSGFVGSGKSILVGLDEDLMRIKDRLTGSPSKLDVISIVGMGGIGKTTLAGSLYNDSLIEHRFDIRAWIVVSQNYHLQEMVSSVLSSIRNVDGGELHHKSTQELLELLYKSLKVRRYLIVMDDFWDTKAWDDIRRFFPDDHNGSRIILTTRLAKVAIYADSYIHYMSLLSPEASWNLLNDKIFGKECLPLELEETGKKIAENCKGLPLAIIVIGGLLSKGSKNQLYWDCIAENVKSSVSGNDDQFMEILSLSYNSLPFYLKPCFLYMGVFPEDHVILVSKLTKLWIAEGFIKPSANKSLENVARDYLKDLIDRSLIMVHKRNHNGAIKSFVIHDMLRDLCVKKAQDEKFLQIMNSDIRIFPEGRNHQRRVSIHSNFLYCLPQVYDSYVRSLLYFCQRGSNNQLLSFTLGNRLLRVLDALTIIFYEFPIQIVELVHLRYLAFIYGGKEEFPASISKLQNLQTLVVDQGKLIFELRTLYLPSSIWEMPQLRHLLLDRSFVPYPLPEEDSCVLENLQTLSEVINFRCSRHVFEIMPNLKKLGILYYHDIDTQWSAHEFNSFVYLCQLETLKCLFIANNYLAERPLPIDFAFPANLKKLTLSGCRIPWEKMTIIGSLPNLEVLKLKNKAFEGSVWEPKEREFSTLKFLLIHKSSLEHWRANEAHFPNLMHLSLSFCFKLMEIPSDIGEIPTLEILELYQCSPSAVASALVIQEEQQSLENDNLKVRINSSDGYYHTQQNTFLRRMHCGY